MDRPPLIVRHWADEMWQRLQRPALEGQSLWLLGPRHFGKSRAIVGLIDAIRQEPDTACMILDAHDILVTGRIDWEAILQECDHNLGLHEEVPVRSASDFALLLESWLASTSRRLVIGLLGVRKGLEEPFFQLGRVLHQAVRRYSGERKPRLQVLLSDEYVLYYHPPLRSASDWQLFAQHPIKFLEPEDVKSVAEHFDRPLAEATLGSIIDVTGGHVGLVRVLLEEAPNSALQSRGGKRARVAAMLRVVRGSYISDKTVEVLTNNPTLCELASSYTDEQVYEPYYDRSAQQLRSLGIVKVEDNVRATLCGEAMRAAVAGVRTAREARSPKPGVSARRDREDAVETLVTILHLSDLHAGDRFRFTLPDETSGRDHIEARLAELIRRDLESLNVRIDGVAITGDSAEKGQSWEFSQAEVILRELGKAISVPVSRMLVIPGNHDVVIRDTGLGGQLTRQNGSLLNFGNFMRLLNAESTVNIVRSTDARTVVLLIGINTCVMTGERTTGIGFIAPEELNKIEKTVVEVEANLAQTGSGQEQPRLVRVVCVHHHAIPVVSQSAEEVGRGGLPSVLLNAPQLFAWCETKGVKAVLHGHHHQPFCARLERITGQGEGPRKNLVIIGAGSSGVRREDLDVFGRNHYYVIQFGRQGMRILSRQLDDEGLKFVRHAEWSLAYEDDSG